MFVGCQDDVVSSTEEIVDGFGNRVYVHNISYDLTLHDMADATTGEMRTDVDTVILYVLHPSNFNTLV